MTFGPSDRYYEPPEPVICCHLAEDDEDHDVEACMAEQAEAAAERKYEAMRDRDREPSDDEIYNRYGVEGGIAYSPDDGPGSLGEHDWRL